MGSPESLISCPFSLSTFSTFYNLLLSVAGQRLPNISNFPYYPHHGKVPQPTIGEVLPFFVVVSLTVLDSVAMHFL